MVHSKVYVDARVRTTNLADSIQNLKSLLEKDIDSGKSFFIRNGFIPLSSETETAFLKFDHNTFELMVRPWLATYGWEVGKSPYSKIYVLRAHP